MITAIKAKLKQALLAFGKRIGHTRVGRLLEEQMIHDVMNQTAEVRHNGLTLNFAVPNALNRFRAATFSTKEPETLEWIDRIPEGSVLWDIGANVGLYSVYAAKQRKCRVYAFEPSVFNLELLARNVHLNGLSDRVCIVPIALSDARGSNKLNMSTTEWGGALSTFGQSFGWDGNAMKTVFVFQTLGLPMTDAVSVLGLPQPDYIKMDVDGIEHFILKHGGAVLEKAQGILVEINDDFRAQAEESEMALRAAGLTLKEKRHSAMFDDSAFQNSFNQIWTRS